jgi:hypothetical protein
MTMITNSSSVPREIERSDRLGDGGINRFPGRAGESFLELAVKMPGTAVVGRQECVERIQTLKVQGGPDGGSSRVDLQACKLGTGRRFTTS